MVQILEGVADGDVVVTTANFLIDSDSACAQRIEGGPRQALHKWRPTRTGNRQGEYPDKSQQVPAPANSSTVEGTME